MTVRPGQLLTHLYLGHNLITEIDNRPGRPGAVKRPSRFPV
jgi:hypothetical protein